MSFDPSADPSLVREGVRIMKRMGEGRQPPYELPADSFLEAATKEILRLGAVCGMCSGPVYFCTVPGCPEVGRQHEDVDVQPVLCCAHAGVASPILDKIEQELNEAQENCVGVDAVYYSEKLRDAAEDAAPELLGLARMLIRNTESFKREISALRAAGVSYLDEIDRLRATLGELQQ